VCDALRTAGAFGRSGHLPRAWREFGQLDLPPS
jgi:hypothetical protein